MQVGAGGGDLRQRLDEARQVARVKPRGDACQWHLADPCEQHLVQAAVQENVRRQVQFLQTSQPIIAGLAQEGKVKVIGAEYDITDGTVDRI